MAIYKKFLLSICFLFMLLTGSIAQDSLSIGSWESFLPYTTANYVSQSPEKIFYSTKWSLFTIDKEDFSIDFFDKINLLTDVGISKHVYDLDGEQLIIIYDDSNMDISNGVDLSNIPDIKNNTSIIGDKMIYNAQINQNRTAYLSCGFGIVEFELDELEFGFSCFTDFPVYQTADFNNYIIAATEDGLYYYDKEKYSNPADFQLWEHIGADLGLPGIYTAIDLEIWKDHVYMITEDKLWKADASLNFEEIFQTDNDSELTFLNKAPGDLMLGVRWVYNVGKVLFFDENDNFIQSHSECSDQINYAVLDETGRLWFADKIGDIRYAESKNYHCESVKINSPFSNNVSDISNLGDMLFISSGGVDASYTYLYRRDGFFIWDGQKWINYNEFTNPFFQQNELYDFLRILPHPDGSLVYIGSYFGGLLELNMEDQSLFLYDKSNSSLAGKTGDELRERISGLAFDKEKNLWISNFGAPKPISMFSNDGEWTAIDVPSGKDLRDVTIDDHGNKWFIIDREAEGFLVYNEGEELANPLDDQYRIFSKNNSALESNNVNAIEVDLNGDVWVGTSDGPVVFECGSGVFEVNSCQGTRRKTSLEGIGAYLLDDVSISCIETDGANRKWFGSENGIFVQSQSGEDQIHHFTSENSPLFDNSIMDLSYNGQSGTMFIATAKGVMSFRTETSSGDKYRHSSDIYAFPNPVRPEYVGPIAIKGFARDSNIKITDINGQLIYETNSLGGQAIWNGKDYNGQKAASGVYLIYATSNSNFDQPETIMTKLLFLK